VQIEPPGRPEFAALDVVVVDDDMFTLKVLEKSLRRLGVARARLCQSAPEALGIVDALAGAKALLVCDLNMPDMDGVEFIKAIAKRKFAGAVLILSGADATVRGAAAHLALAYGVNLVGTLEKPLALDRLAAALDAALEG
jgi:DNA-binding NtrC family response regulator